MKIEKIGHYSITNHESVYDEEAMTALELAGRTAKKVNDVIDYLDEATSQVERIPEVVNEHVETYIKDGSFDDAINEYAGDLEGRLDNLLGNTPEGSTTMDAEIIDARSMGSGRVAVNLGTAIRNQYEDVKDSDDDKLSARAVEYGYKKNLNRRSLWLQGWLSSETGEHGTSGTDGQMYIATTLIPETVERVITNGHPMEVFVFSKNDVFLHKETGRRDDYTFDHTNHKYKIHVTGYVPLVADYDVKKYPISVASKAYADILFLAEPIEEITDTVSATAQKHGYKRDLNRRSLWSQGYLYGATGLEGIDPAGYDYWIYNRSDFLPADVEKIAVDGGYKARLFKYDIKKNFVGYVDVTGVSDYLDESYYYRVDVRPTTAELGDRNLVNDVWNKVKLLSVRDVTAGSSATGVNSPFKTDAVFKPYSHKHITIEADEWCENISESAKAGESYNDLCFSCADFIGYDSGGYTIGIDRLIPSIVDKTTPKILIVGGQHGFEKGSVLGLDKLIQHLTENFMPDILRQVELLIIPCLCPVAFERNTYWNANDVNLNRNYGYAWKPYQGDDADNYGEAPFDQPETRALRDLILKEKPDIVIDFHSLGSGVVDRETDMNVFYACGFTDPYYMKLKNAIIAHLNDFQYSYDQTETYVSGRPLGRYEGFDGTINNKASLDNWCAYELNTLSLTVEGHNGFTASDLLSPYAIARNCEIILNFLCQVLAEYSRG